MRHEKLHGAGAFMCCGGVERQQCRHHDNLMTTDEQLERIKLGNIGSFICVRRFDVEILGRVWSCREG
jgi:hypothetical protein